ncbi:MAG TPA: GntR family transcriptional regulator [Ruminiclostridium sp.]|jgi:DNA-binding transcriptional regulator YhcF (GntR family)|nr:GntR family transcriptional regulator [Clostridiaceae bacterium]HAA25212.1 GntR family transcriptional regulator [Ruminiclostridium sp.]
MPWELKADRPIYAQLIEQIELKICSGIYAPGSRLPSVRDLAREASVNPNTMQRALAKLEEDGLLYSTRTSGRFVTEDDNVIYQVKNKLAQEQIQDFLKKMKQLGFENKEILSMLKTMLEEVKR